MTKQEIFQHLNNPNTGNNWRLSFYNKNAVLIERFLKKEMGGDIIDKLKELHKAGHGYVQMKVHKPDGIAKWRLVSSNNFILKGNDLSETSDEPTKKTKTPPKTKMRQHKSFEEPAIAQPVYEQPVQVPGLAGVGLGQYLEAFAGSRMHQITREELQDIKSKYENAQSEIIRLKDENNELKRKTERLEDQAERKSFMDNLDVNTLLPALVGLLKPNPAAAGLNAPARQQLTPYKEALREQLENDAMPEAIAQQLYSIMEQYATNNVKFVNELISLINQHSIKKAD